MEDQQTVQTEPSPDDLTLYGISELAERWGVSKQRADEIATKRLPKPMVLKMGRIWTEPQVKNFEKGWVRKTGRHVSPHPWRQSA
jgi:hypothetical protein